MRVRDRGRFCCEAAAEFRFGLGRTRRCDRKTTYLSDSFFSSSRVSLLGEVNVSEVEREGEARVRKGEHMGERDGVGGGKNDQQLSSTGMTTPTPSRLSLRCSDEGGGPKESRRRPLAPAQRNSKEAGLKSPAVNKRPPGGVLFLHAESSGPRLTSAGPCGRPWPWGRGRR